MHISKSLLAFTLYVASINLALAAPVNPVEVQDIASNDLEIRTGHPHKSNPPPAKNPPPPPPANNPPAKTNPAPAKTTAGSSKSHPIEGTMEVNANNALPFDADCYAILCLEKEPLFQRDGSESNDNRKDAGVKKTFPGGKGTGPFRNPTKADVKIPGAQYVSPEEFPFASTTQGGHQAILFPVSEASQDSQGGTINGFYRKHKIDSAHQGPNSWYKITGWSGAALGPYCKALQANKGKSDKNDPVCKSGHQVTGTWGFDVGEYAYTYDGHSYHKAKGSK